MAPDNARIHVKASEALWFSPCFYCNDAAVVTNKASNSRGEITDAKTTVSFHLNRGLILY